MLKKRKSHDTSLMAELVIRIEDILSEENISLTAEKKAKLYVHIYEEVVNDDINAESIEAKMQKLLHLIKLKRYTSRVKKEGEPWEMQLGRDTGESAIPQQAGET